MARTIRQNQNRGETSRLLPRLASLCAAGAGLVTIFAILGSSGLVSPQSEISASFATVTLGNAVTTLALQATELHVWAAAALVAVVLLLVVRLTLGPAAWADDGGATYSAQA